MKMSFLLKNKVFGPITSVIKEDHKKKKGGVRYDIV